MTKHSILGGKVHVYKRENNPYWQCASYLAGKNHRTSTKTDSLSQAKEFAEDWYLGLRGKLRDGDLHGEKTFTQAAQRFMDEYEVLTDGERNERWVQDHFRRIRLHLNPFFGKMGLSQVSAGAVQDYRIARLKPEEGTRVPSRSTLHHESVTLRQVLKTAVRHRWLSHVPDVSAPYRASGKVVHRAWFSRDEYRKLYEATRKNIKQARNKRERHLAEQLHDKVLFMANTGIRPDEANWLEYRDVEIVEDDATGETISPRQARGGIVQKHHRCCSTFSEDG